MDRHNLDLMVAQAKREGDHQWSVIKGKFMPCQADYELFAKICAVLYPPKTLINNYLMFEMYLRAGKHMNAAIKTDNRRKADKLRNEILRK